MRGTPAEMAAYYLSQTSPNLLTPAETAEVYLRQAKRAFRSGRKFWPDAVANFQTWKIMIKQLG